MDREVSERDRLFAFDIYSLLLAYGDRMVFKTKQLCYKMNQSSRFPKISSVQIEIDIFGMEFGLPGSPRLGNNKKIDRKKCQKGPHSPVKYGAYVKPLTGNARLEFLRNSPEMREH